MSDIPAAWLWTEATDRVSETSGKHFAIVLLWDDD
jgi:hypothetical protein